MKNVIGTPARGDSFFPRTREIAKIINKIEAGNNLNIAAPRRVGKTSILLNLLDKVPGGYTYTYVDTEDIDSEKDFFRRILKELLRTEAIRNSRRLKNLIETGHKFLSRVKGVKVLGQALEFVEEATVSDPKEDLINLLAGLELDDTKGLVILLDEFPQTVQNIIDSNPDDLSHVRKFLQANREIRLNPEINKKVRFVLTGSIGLNLTVAQIGMTAFINDLNSVEIGPLTGEEGLRFVERLLQPKGVIVDTDTKKYLLEKIEWLIPFHIQLMVQEIGSITDTNTYTINKKDVDKAFESILQRRNENHFNHYFSRLKKQFKGNEFSFADDLLDLMARREAIGEPEIYNLSVKYGLEKKWRGILEVLIYDGYISIKGLKDYRFNSPIVKMWWRNFICK